MAEAVKARRRRESASEEERRQLLEGMAMTRAELTRAYAEFNVHSDPELVDACVYAINALRCRYSWYVRRVKQLDGGEEAV
jgi:hypothetical protein